MGQVTIHSRGPATRTLPDGTVENVVAVTYSTVQVPPRTIWVPADQADDAHVAAAIRKDMESLPPASTLEV